MNSDSSRAIRKAAERHALPVHQSRSRETCAQILEAAEREFADKGYDGARLSDIAERAGCSVGTVYFRFKDKSALFLAIAESFAEEARVNIKGAFVLSGDAEEVVRQFVTGAARNFRKHKGLFRAIVERGLEQPRAMKPIFALREEFAHALETILKRTGKRNIGLRVRVMTQMIYGFLLAGVLNPYAPTDITDSRTLCELADACVAYLNAGG